MNREKEIEKYAKTPKAVSKELQFQNMTRKLNEFPLQINRIVMDSPFFSLGCSPNENQMKWMKNVFSNNKCKLSKLYGQ